MLAVELALYINVRTVILAIVVHHVVAMRGAAGTKELLEAAALGEVATVRALLDTGVDKNAVPGDNVKNIVSDFIRC